MRTARARPRSIETPLYCNAQVLAFIAGLCLLLPWRGQAAGYWWLFSEYNSDYLFEKIDPATGAVIQNVTHAPGTLLTGEFAFGGGYLWLFNENDNQYVFEKIDPTTGAVAQTITHATGTLPTGEFAVANGYLWLFSEFNNKYVFEKIDTNSGAVLQSITNSVGTLATGAFAVSGGYFWLFGVYTNNYVFEKIDTNSGAVLQYVTHAPGSLATGQFAAAGTNLWLYNESGSNYVFEQIDPASGAVFQTTTHAAGKLPSGEFAVEQQWTVGASVSPAGSGTVTGGGTYDDWTNATLTATPASCYSFLNWTLNGTVVSTSPANTFTVTTNESLTANFATTTYTVAVSNSPPAGGTTTGGGTYDCDSAATVTATANAGYFFIRWTAGTNTLTNSAIYTFAVSSNRTVTANFGMAPVIVDQPQNRGVELGSNASFTVTADGTLPLHYQWFFNGGILARATNANLTITNVQATNFGNYTVVITNIGGSVTSSPPAVLELALPTFMVTAVNPNASGVTVDFNRFLDSSALFLYGTTNPPDVTLIGATSGPVGGSLIIGVPATNVTFIKTNMPLAPDTYTLTLVSATNGFQDISNNLLDGNDDGFPGANYVGQFTVAASTDRVLSVPGFARAPGQAVNVPAQGSGIPLKINNGSGVVSVSLTVQYNTNLLTVTGVTRGTNLPAAWTLTSNTNLPGSLAISASGTTTLRAGTNILAAIQARVPWCAPYGAAGILSISSPQVNKGAIGVTGINAVQVAALPGDTDGNGVYDTNDYVLISQYAGGLISGFPAYPLIHPAILGDVADQLGIITSNDVTVVEQEVNGLAPASIPAQPMPSLTIAMQTNQLTISWLECLDGYILQSSPTLGADAIWTAITNTPVVMGDEQTVTLSPPATPQYYRLMR